MSQRDRNKIFQGLLDIQNNPFFGPNILKMSGPIDCYRKRVGIYRIVYQVHKHEIIISILNIGHRKDVYR